MKVRLSDIEWDTEVDGVVETPPLPTTMIVSIHDTTGVLDQIVDQALDVATNETGWCIHNCKVEVLDGQAN